MATLKYDLEQGIKHLDCLVTTGQTPETSTEMQASISAIDTLVVKFKEVRNTGHASFIKDATMYWNVTVQEGLLGQKTTWTLCEEPL